MAGRQAFANVQQQFNRVHHHMGSSPLILWFLGGLVLLLWGAGSVVQIQTSEYLAMGATSRVAGVAWGVLLQPLLMLTGQAPVAVVTAWMYGWVVEVVTLVYALALAAAVRSLSQVNPLLAKFFVALGLLLIGLNGWADYSSSPGTQPLVQFLIALALALIVTCGLPLGVGLLERGFEEL
jgi:hypothetical protein